MVGRERRPDRSDLASMEVRDLRYGVHAQVRAVVRASLEMQELRRDNDGDDGQERVEADLSTSKGPLNMKPPKELDRIVDKVLAYKVPARSKKAKKRQRKRRAQRVSCI